MTSGDRRDRPLLLIAEDDDDIRRLLEIRLVRARFDLSVAVDGREALRVALAGAPDLVVLDLALPGLEGLSILEQIRASENAADVPVILLSANVHESQIRDGMRRGATAYVKKPFQLEELLKTIERSLHRR